MDNINWLSFHSGYDFGYLLKLLTDQNLPQEENDFFESLRMYFPTVYDVKVRKHRIINKADNYYLIKYFKFRNFFAVLDEIVQKPERWTSRSS